MSTVRQSVDHMVEAVNVMSMDAKIIMGFASRENELKHICMAVRELKSHQSKLTDSIHEFEVAAFEERQHAEAMRTKGFS